MFCINKTINQMYKKYFKKLFKIARVSFSVIFSLFLIFGQIFSVQIAQAATYSFTQNNWSGLESSEIATHQLNKTGWSYITENNNLNIAENVSSSLSSSTKVLESESDFAKGDNFQTEITGSGELSSVSLNMLGMSEIQLTTSSNGEGIYLIDTNGEVWSWGRNTNFQLGVPDMSNRTTPAKIQDPESFGYLDNAKKISAADTSVFLLKKDGTVFSWGYNGYGQLGDDTLINKNKPTQVKGEEGVGFLSEIKEIHSNKNTAFAINNNGDLYAWGQNNYGQLGDSSTTTRKTPVRVKGPEGVGFLTNIKKVIASNNTTYALREDGTLYAWGQNNYGQLGNGTNTQINHPTQVVGVGGNGHLTNILDITTSNNSTYALKEDGTLYSWGYNGYGQLGNGTNTNKNTPVQVVGVGGEGYLNDVDQISSNTNFIIAKLKNKTLLGWGQNSSRQLADGTTSNRYSPVQVRGVLGDGYMSNIKEIYASPGSVYALTEDNILYSWGSNVNGKLGDGSTVTQDFPVTVKDKDGVSNLSGISQVIISNSNSAYATKINGTIYSWGQNNYGQLGDGTIINKNIPVNIKVENVSNFVDLKEGLGTNTFVVTGNNTGNIFLYEQNKGAYAWGRNDNGQLADGTLNDRNFAVQVEELDGIQSLIAGGLGTSGGAGFALKTDGTVYGWGSNNGSKLGNGNSSMSAIPIQVKGVDSVGFLSGVSKLESLGDSVYALKNDGTLYAWGKNDSGQLGDGTTQNKNTPIQVLGLGGDGYLLGVEDVVTSGNTVYALKTDGTVYAWGNNTSGQVGDNSTTNRNTPVQVKGVNGEGFLINITRITASSSSVYALKDDGTVYAWGNNSNGRLGDGSTTNRSTPVQVKGVDGVSILSGITQIVSSKNNSMYALSVDGTIYAWGRNDYGQLGDGSLVQRNIPVLVKGEGGVGVLSNVNRISTGDISAYALMGDGTVYAWGNNSNRQLGDGTNSNRTTPVKVLGQNGSGFLDDVRFLTSDIHTAFAISNNGNIYAWGRNDYGQLGDTTNENKPYPVLVKKGTVSYSDMFVGINSYYPEGVYTSPIVDLEKEVILKSINYDVTTNGQNVTVDVRAGNTNIIDGSWTNWANNISDGESLLSLGNKRFVQYRVNLTTSDSEITPTFDSITFNYSEYVSGYLISSIFDTEDSESGLSKVSWSALGESETSKVLIKVRTSPDKINWSLWYGFSGTGEESDYFKIVNRGVTISPLHPMNTGNDDRYFQYKLEINPEGYSSPVVQSVSVDYEMNKPPEIRNVQAYQIQDRNSDDLGKVLLSYEVKDIDTNYGVNHPGKFLPKIEYKIGESSNWIDASILVFPDSPILRQEDVSLKEVNGSSYTTHEAILNVKNIIRGHDSSISGDNLFARVTVDDGENIRNLTSAYSEGISIDTKIPYFENEKLSATLDAGIIGVEDSALIKIKRPIESSGYVEYRVFDFRSNANGENIDTGWVEMIGEEVSIPWSFDNQINSKIVGLNFRDLFNNEDVNETITLVSPDPIYEKSFVVQDVSNVETNYYAMYLGWLKMSHQNFSHFKIEKFILPDGINFYKDGEAEDPVLSDTDTDFYLYKNLSPSFIHKFLISVVDIYGNVSLRHGNDLIVKADGLQNYGEGGGGILNQSAIINNVIATQNNEKDVVVTYKITDPTVYEKDNPSFEEYLFYYNGLTLSDNPYDGTFLNLSSSSGLKDSGYVLINNEVIKYNNKNNNIIGGLVRGTWPNLVSEGRETRHNTDFFAGTPVWVMADNTTPNSFDHNDYFLEEGVDMSISWDTFNETGLMGGNYKNVGIRVVAHDNNGPNYSPLSTQNDYSEDGLLQTLDLTNPSVSFEISEIATIENGDNFPVNIILDRPYVFDVSIDYSISGTASYGLDYSTENGSLIIPAGTTTVTLNLPIIDDTVKENSETILVTLKNPVNAQIGQNNIFTLTIEDNDSNPDVGFSLSTVSNTENVISVKIPIILSEVSGADVVVSFEVSGSATSGSDFSLVSGDITILKGEDEARIDLIIIDDTKKEDDETVIVKLTGVIGANLNSNTTYTYTIVDNDTYPTLSFGSITSQGREDSNVSNITVNLSSPYPEDITFRYTVTGGSAEGSGIDYRIEDNQGIIDAGQTSTIIPIIIYDDDLSEETENILITLSDPINAVLGTDIVHAFSILDNEILVSDINGASVKSTSARVVWNTADYTNSLIEYGTIPDGEEGSYGMFKQSLEKVLNHNVYLDELIPETTYYFKTTSTNLAGDVTVSRSQFTTTPGPILSNVSQNGETDTGVTITWATDLPSTSLVTYSTDPNMTSPLTLSFPDLVTEHQVELSGLMSNETYYYLVSSTDESGNTGEGANGGSYYTFSTGDDETPPIISNIKTPIRTNSQVAITWSTNEPADGVIRYGEEPGVLNNETELIHSLVTAHLVTISDLKESNQYYYVIESADENNNKTTTEELTFETTAKEKEIIYSGGGSSSIAQELYDILLAENQAYKARYSSLNEEKPVISNIEVSNINAFGGTISFNTNEDTIAFVKYKKTGGPEQISGNDSWSQRHSMRLTGLSLGTEYTFIISAIDKSNDTGNSEEQKFTTKYLSENLSELNNIENVEQFQKEIENTIESILPSLVPPFIEKPTVSDITENSAIINFRTNIKSFPIVSYSEEYKYDENKENPYEGEMSSALEKSLSHAVKLIGLKPNTLYHFSAKAYSLPGVIGKYQDLTFTTKASKIQASIVEIKKDSFVVAWYTDEPTSSIVEYKNTKTGRLSKIVDSEKKTSHSIKIENLDHGTNYEVLVSGVNNKDNVVESNSVISAKTSTDSNPPVVTNLKVDSALVQGRTDRVQTIVSWQTDEPSTSIVYYEEGSGGVSGELDNKQEDLELIRNHVVILGALKPGTVYRFTVSSTDDVGNTSKLPIRTIITPKKTESIVDVIFKNFDETFNFINNVK